MFTGLFLLGLVFFTLDAQANLPMQTKSIKASNILPQTAVQKSIFSTGGLVNTSSLASSIQSSSYLKSSYTAAVSMKSSSALNVSAMASSTSTPTTLMLNADEVADLARALNYDPLKIFNYVYNNINYTPYFGVQKGAPQTLIDKNGNDFDQAVLLAALLKDCPSSSGVTSVNYVLGIMTMPLSGLANWLNVDAAFPLVQQILNNNGIPNGNANTTNNTLDVVRLWLQVTINGKTYVLDPAYKQYSYKIGINIPQAMGYTQSGLLSAVNSGATIASNYVQNLNETALRNLLASYSNNLIATMRSQYPNAQTSDILGGRSIQQVLLKSLPAALPFVTSNTSTATSIPNTFDTLVEIKYDGIDITLPSLLFTGKRFMLHYLVSGTTCQPFFTVDDGMVSDSSGKAVLGTSIALGTTGNMTMTVTHPYSGNGTNPFIFTSNYIVSSGSTYSIISDFGGGVGDALIKKRQQILNEALVFGDSNNPYVVQDETLNIMGLTYLKEKRATQDIIAKLSGMAPVYLHSIGRIAQESSYYIDIADNTSTISAQHTGMDNTVPASFAGAGFDSAYEVGMMQQMSPPSFQGMSTVHVLELAISQGQKIYAVNSANLALIQPLLSNYNATDISEIQGWVNAGNTVYIPANGLITVGNWQGPIYLIVGQSSQSISEVYAMGDDCFCGEDVVANQKVSTSTVVSVNQAILPALNQTIQTETANEPVDMTTGGFLHDHLDLALGGAAPLGLSFSRHYLSTSNLITTALGNGWEHNYDIRLTQQSDVDPVLGLRAPVEAASLIVAAYTVFDILNAQNNADGWMTAALIQKWATDQMYNNSINVNIGQKVLTYIKLPDGSYAAPPGVTVSLIKNSNGTFKLQDRIGSVMNFNANNQVSSIQDVDGHTMTFTYNSSNLLSSVTDQFGRTLNFAYNGNGLLTAVTDSASRSVSFGYDSNSNLTNYTDATGKPWSYGYDGNLRMTSITNPLGTKAVTNTYNAQGQVITQLVPRQGGTQATYNFYFNGVNNAIQDPYGNLTTYNLDNIGRTISVTDALGDTSAVTYDGQNHVVSAIDPLGHIINFTYDGNNDLINIQYVLNASTTNTYTYGYNLAFDLTSITGPLSDSTTFSYDSKHHLLQKTSPLSASTCLTMSFSYLTNGFLSTMTDPLGYVTTYTYDAYGNPLTAKTGAHPVIT
ncbi:MAG: hypothetical protein HQL13_00755, partial [Candidatus Omnitrophica bacterium]|nr:hypothetical protein [Candidatus Omnitrophota bacterium]